MGKFVLSEHLPASVSQYLLPTSSSPPVTPLSSSSSSSSLAASGGVTVVPNINNGNSTAVRNTRRLHPPSSTNHHRRYSEPPTPASTIGGSTTATTTTSSSSKLYFTTDRQKNTTVVSVTAIGGSGKESESNVTATTTASDEELSSICAEENVEVIHSLRIGGSDGRLSPSFAPSTIRLTSTATTATPTTSSYSKKEDQKKKKKHQPKKNYHRKSNIARAFLINLSSSDRKNITAATAPQSTSAATKNATSSRRGVDGRGIIMGTNNSDEGDPDSSFYLNNCKYQDDDDNNKTSLKLDRFGFITNLDSKGRVIELSSSQHSDHDPTATFNDIQRTERREKKWNGMIQGLGGGRRDNSSRNSSVNAKNDVAHGQQSVSNRRRRANDNSNKTTKKTSAAGASTASSKRDSKSNETQTTKRKAPPATAATLPRPNMAISRTKNQKQMIRRLRKGVPDTMRGRVWSVLGGGVRVAGLYQDIVQYTSDAMLDSFKEIQQIEMQKKSEITRTDNGIDQNHHHDPKNVTSRGDTSPRPNTASIVTTVASSQAEATSSASTPSSQAQNNRRSDNDNESPSNGGTITSDNDNKEFVTTRQFRSIQDTIERDIHRTYPRHNLFYEEDRYSQGAGVSSDATSGSVSPVATGSQTVSSSHKSNSKTTTVMLASPTETQMLIASGFCDPDMAAMIINLERDIRTASTGETSAPVQPSDGASYTTTPGGQAALRRVLRAYSYYDQEVGYCQGMNFIAGMFLTFMTEEEAFWLLVAVMHNEPCKMRGMFGEGMRETHKVLYVGEKLLHHYLPRLARHFDKEHIHVTMFATQWLLTLYTSSFKFDLVFRVWDAYLGEGWKIIYRVMLALLQKYQNQLTKMSFEEILTFFRELPDRVDGNQIMEMAMKIPLRKKVISKYENDWNHQQPS